MNPVDAFAAEVKTNIESLGNATELQSMTKEWMLETIRHRYTYNFTSLGRPIIQYPQDMVAMHELIWQVKPTLIIETGIAHGGSLIHYASMLALIDLCEATEKGELLNPSEPKRRILGIDIDIRSHNKAAILAHPLSKRIDLIQGSSISDEVIGHVEKYAAGAETIMVVLDSNHTHDHVLAELNAYAHLVSVGSYCVVYDTIVEDMPEGWFKDRPWNKGDNPKTAVWAYLKEHPEFQIDKQIENKIQITVGPDGYLIRTR